MADITKAKEAVRETLLGAEQVEDVKLSAHSKATFDKNSQKDEDTGELYMSEGEFINAIAPETEDYVSEPALLPSAQRGASQSGRG